MLAHPAILAVTAAAALLVALATATPPLFASASGNAALQTKLIEVAPLGAGLEVIRTSTLAPNVAGAARFLRESDARGRTLAQAVADPTLARGRVSTLLGDRVGLSHRGIADEARLLARTGAEAQLRRLRVTSDAGFWIADVVASHLRLGDTTVRVDVLDHGRRVTVPVVNVYRALAYLPPSDLWVNFTRDIYPYGTDHLLPPPFLVGTRAAVVSAYARLGGGRMREVWEFPVDTRNLTVARATSLLRRFDALDTRISDHGDNLANALGCFEASDVSCEVHTSLRSAIDLARRDATAVSAPTRLLGYLAALVALAAVGAAAAFLVARRRDEARLLYTWGEAAPVFAARTLVEVTLPTVAGGATGFALAWLAVRIVSRHGGSVDGDALWRAGGETAVALALALAVSGAVAAHEYLRRDEHHSPRRLRWVPWELVLVAVAVVLLVRVRGGGGFVEDAKGGSHPSLAVFLLPLPLVGGVALAFLRLLRNILRRVGRGAASVPLRLALRRLAYAGSRITVLTTLCAISLGALFYAATLATSLDHAVLEKAYVAVGGDAAATVSAAGHARLAFPATYVDQSYAGAAIGTAYGPQIDVIGIDPATFPDVVHWLDAWGSRPSAWARTLAEPGKRLPAVATTGASGIRAIWIDGVRIAVNVVATVRTVPGMSRARPAVVVSTAAATRAVGRAGGGDPFETAFTAVWARGDPSRLKSALEGSALRPEAVVTIDDVKHDPDVTVSSRTYSFLYALGAALGFVTLLGLALYLAARQRTQAVADAFATRMGMSANAALGSLGLEIGLILALASVVAGVAVIAAAVPIVGRTDPLPALPPTPATVLPTTVVALTAAALVAAGCVATVYAYCASRRVDVGEALRLG